MINKRINISAYNDKKGILFRFKEHPGDLLRNTSISLLPEMGSEDFVISFYPCYQNSQDVANLNDLYKIWYDELSDEDDHNIFINEFRNNTKEDINRLIHEYEFKINHDCCQHFYHLVRTGTIEIIDNS